MTARVLPPEEWGKLAGTDAEAIVSRLHPDVTIVVVVEEDGKVIAHHLLFYALHAECLWVHPDYRKTRAGAKLWSQVQKEVRAAGASAFLTAADSDEVRKLIEHVGGTEIPGTQHSVPVGV